ncbi:MAG: DUF4249 domain-containing protein [Saprospiraceae bacterium]
MKNEAIAFLVLVLLLPLHCADPFTPELEGSDQLLVVEGTITNAPGPYFVKLSSTTAIEHPFPLPVKGATVVLSEQDGPAETLTETEPGTYATSAWGIQGEAGKKYKIAILLPDGREYESAYEEIPQPEAIDSVYAEVDSRTDPAYTYPLRGYQFYLDASVQHQESKYFLWKLTETYKFNSDLLIPYYYAGQLLPFPKPDSLFTCYKTSDVKDIFVLDAERLETPQVRRYPLHFVDTEGRKLFLKYSLLVEQYVVGKEAFAFWSHIKRQNTGLGALYTTQPFQIRGNISNVGDPEEAVLGYFMAAGYAERRLFVERPPGVEFHFGVCTIGEPEIYEMLGLSRTRPSTWPIYLGQSPDGGPMGVPDQVCADCRQKKATIEKPGFWID